MAKGCKSRFVFETLEDRRCLAGAGVNAITGPVSVFDGEIVAFDTKQELGGDYFGEIGHVNNLSEAWKTVYFTREFADPIVVLSPLSFFDVSPATIRTRNVTANSFEVRVESWEYLDDAHGLEEIAYLALERGSFETEDGLRFVAGSVDASADWQSAEFPTAFSQSPVVITQIASDINDVAVSEKIRGVTSAGFDILLSSELADTTLPETESVSFVAVASGVTATGTESQLLPASVDHLFSEIAFSNSYTAPRLFAGVQSYFESDPGSLRILRNSQYDSLSPTGVAVRFQEEDSRNSANPIADPLLRRHLPEDLGVFVREADRPLQGFDVSLGTVRSSLPADSQVGYGAVKPGDLQWGSGLVPDSSVFDDFFSATGWDASTLQEAVSGEDYLSFQIEIAANYTASLSRLGISLFSDGGDREFSIFTGATGFQPGAEIATLGPTMLHQSPDVDLSAVTGLQNLQGPLEIRIYGHGHAETNDAAGLAMQSGAELSLTAEIVAIPLPSATISAPAVSALEGTDNHVTFAVTLDEQFFEPIQVSLDVVGQTATANLDYASTPEYSLDGGSSWFAGTDFALPASRTSFLARVALLDDSELETTETLQLCVSLLGPTIDTSVAPVSANIWDDDRRLIVTETGDDTTVSEYGVQDEIAISLSDPPATNVEVHLSVDTLNEVQLSQSTVTFTPTDWNVPQTVILGGVPDFSTDGNSVSNLSLSVAPSSAIEFRGLPPTVVPVVNLEWQAARVLDERIFYNNSGFDQDQDLSPADDAAIAPSPTEASMPELGKTSLHPGETASFRNYTSYSRGINGVMLDVEGLADPDALSLDDFEFHVGSNNITAEWAEAPEPIDISVREGAGVAGADRVSILWANNAIQKQWLQVKLRNTTSTGLDSSYTFYWGNAIGETGDQANNTGVDLGDLLGIQSNQHTFLDLAPIDDAFDIDRDRLVSAFDLLATNINATSFLNSLPFITPPLTVSIDSIHDDTAPSGDFTTEDQTLYIHGSFTEGASLNVAVNGDSFELGVDSELTSDGYGNWTLNYTATSLPIGEYTATVTSELGDQVAQDSQSLSVVAPPSPPDPIPDIDSNLVAHWDFDGSVNDIALLGLTQDDLIEVGETALILGGFGSHALHTSGGTGNGFDIGSSVDLNETQLDEFSVSLWFHTRDQVDGSRLLYQQGDADRGIAIYLFEGQLYAGAWDVGIGWEGTWLTMPTKNYQWQHVSLTLDATADAMQLYGDGVLQDSGFAGVVPSHAAGALTGSTTPIRIWNPSTQTVQVTTLDSFLGWVDDTRIYRRVLNAVDVEHLATTLVPEKVVADLPIWENIPSPQYELPTGGTTYNIPHTYTSVQVQQVLDNLQGNDIVRLDPNGHWESIILRNTSPGVKYIISDAIDSLPAFGERIDPTYAHLMPTISTGTEDTAPILPALNSEIGASDYHIAGVRLVKPVISGEFSGIDGDHDSVSIAMLNRVAVGGQNSTFPALSPPTLGTTATTYEAVGGNFVFDRVIFEGDDIRTRNGLLINGKDTAIVGSYFHRIIDRRIFDTNGSVLRNPTESHGIEIVDSPGRFLVENNHLSVGSIGVMLGNNGPLTTDIDPVGGQIPGLIPPMEDIVVRGNFITKDLAWSSEIEALTGTAAIKNALETKGSNRLLWENNSIENILNGNQKHALVVKVSNGQETDNTTIRNNQVIQATGGAAFSNHLDARNNDEPLRVGNITMYDNEIVDIGPMPPDDAESFPIIVVSSLGNPIESLVMFDNNLRRRNYFEPREVGFAFSNNELQHVERFSFLSSQMDCAQFGGFVGTGLGANFANVLDNFTGEFAMEDNVFFACFPGYDIPDDNRIFTAFIELDPIAGDDFINASEDDGTIPITGRLTRDASEGDLVEVTVNGNTYTDVATTVGSTLRFTIPVPASDLLADSDSVVDAEFTTTDFAGYSINPTDTRAFVVDLVAPQAPAVTILEDANDDQFINISELMGDVDVEVSLPIDAVEGDTVTATDGSTSVDVVLSATDISNGNAIVSFTPPVEGEVFTVSAFTTDAAGNVGPTGNSDTATRDTEAPTIAIDTVAGDNIINGIEDDADVTVSGTTTAEDNQQVTVTLNAKTYIADVLNGAWTVDVPAADISQPELGPGVHDVTAEVSDIAGNPASPATQAITYDPTAPDAPDVVITEDANDDGFINISELLDDVEVEITLPTNAVEGDTLSATDEVTQQDILLDAGHISAGKVEVTFAPPAEGASISASAYVTDVAGNVGPTGSDIATRDTEAPTIAIDTVAGDNIINDIEDDADVAVSGTTTAEDNQQVTVTLNAETYIADVLNGTWTVDIPTVDISLPNLSPGIHNVTAEVSDIAGNPASPATQAITYDPTAPDAPDVVITEDANDDGFINISELVDDVDVEITLPNDAVEGDTLTATDGATQQDILLDADHISAGKVDVTFAPPAEGVSISASAYVTDAAGNVGPTGSDTATGDTEAPTIAIDAVAGDNIINGIEDDADVAVSGTTTAEDNQQVTVTLNSKTYIADVLNGTWTVDIPAVDISLPNLSPGVHDVTAEVSDIAGNPASPATQAITYDPTAPDAPDVVITEDANDDQFINISELVGDVDVEITLPNDAVAGDTLTATDGATQQDTLLDADHISAGKVDVTFAPPAEGASITASAYVTDVAGNMGPTGSDTATGDTEAPTIAIDTVAGDNIINGIEDDADVTVSGTTTSEDSQQVTVTLNAKTYFADVLNGAWTVGIPAADISQPDLSPGVHNVTAEVSDIAGNPASPATQAITYDPTVPDAPDVVITEDANDDGFVNISEFVDDVDVEIMLPNNAVEGDALTATDGVTQQDILLDADHISAGKVDVTFAPPAEGVSITASAYVTDVAGNVGPTGSDTATRDTEAPNAPLVTITEDANNDGVIETSELSGLINVSVVLPTGTEVGDLLSISDGVETDQVSLGSLADVLADFASPGAGNTITVSAFLEDKAGNVGLAGSDIAQIAAPPSSSQPAFFFVRVVPTSAEVDASFQTLDDEELEPPTSRRSRAEPTVQVSRRRRSR